MLSRGRARVGLLMMTLGALLAAASCSNPKSFIVLRLRSSTPDPIPGVTEIGVAVMQGTTLMQTLIYPPPKGATIIAINQVTITDLSVSFTGGHSGSVTFDVTARNAAGCEVGRGSKTTIIKKGDIGTETVDLVAHSCTSADGGVDAEEVDAFPGCDPVEPACGIGRTCQVNCMTKMGECTDGGTGVAGTSCQMNKDCTPGTQCFDYAGTGCPVKLCLRFCNNDLGCAAGTGGDGGAAVGTKSLCAGPVQCSGAPTAYHTCSFACDPRQPAAAAGTSGCPSGLSCLLVEGNMDQVDCGCAGPTRVGMDGADCTGSLACAPGFICNIMGGSQKCRAVCRCDASGMTCMTHDTCAGGKTCLPLINDTKFGACL